MPGGTSQQVGEVIAEPDDPAAWIFDQAQLRTYAISVEPRLLAEIDANPRAEAYVPATLRVNGESAEVGLRYKGSVGSFLMPCTAGFAGAQAAAKAGKCSMKIAFDWRDDDARFHGLKKLNFHGMGRDPSMMRERLGYALYREMGVASPRTVHARLEINGKLEGVFLVVEQIDGRFTRSRFSEGGEGNLYKEVWPLYEDELTYRRALESNKGPVTDVRKMLALKRATDASESEAWFDWDYMMRYAAVDRVIMNDDGVFHWYCFPQGNNPSPFSSHNYYWYEASNAGRFWLLPWDLDNSFAPNTRVHIQPEWSNASDCTCQVSLGLPQRAAACDPLVAQLAATRSAYEKSVDAFLAGPFFRDRVDAKLDAWIAQVRPLVAESAGVLGSPDPMTWDGSLAELRNIIALARENRGFPYQPAPVLE